MSERIEAVAASQEIFISLITASRTASSWEEAHSAVDAILTDLAPVLREEMAPHGALALMSDWLLPDEASAQKQAVLASQTELMLEKDALNDQFVIALAQALERLEGYWSDEQLAKAATDILGKMETHQQRSQGMVEKLPAELKAKMKSFDADRIRAVETLQSMR